MIFRKCAVGKINPQQLLDLCKFLKISEKGRKKYTPCL
jgi:hypothetical protein